MRTLPDVTLQYPEPWFQVPVEPGADLDSWAVEHAQRIVREAATADPEVARTFKGTVKGIAKELRGRAEGFQNRYLTAAFFCIPPGLASTDVSLELMIIHPGEGDPDPSLEWFTEACVTRELGEPDTRDVDLPFGPAVRIRQNYLGGKKNWFGGRPVLNSLIYGVRPPGQTDLVSVTALWQDVAIGDVIEEWTDEMLRTLRFAHQATPPG
ncbi:hypothetical protein [Streptomyces xiamenensis]|uniref:hypothetical protein n=1 Tax=Streptomyces xiamenensis TaxID=408015 RepID=UPI0037D96593